MRVLGKLAAVLIVLALAPGCGANDPSAPDAGEAPARVLAHLVVSGNPESTTGATWVYRDTVDGVVYDLSGVLLKPAGSGLYPAVIVSHGFGGTAAGYSRSVGTTVVRWGAVAIAVNYTHAVVSGGSPGGTSDFGASVANVQRARRLVEILRALGYVDMTRIGAHGHSMGAFVTTAFAASHPDLLRVASHTAGGVRPDGVAGPAPPETQGATIRTPYQMHHGDQDVVVSLASDQRLDAVLSARGTPRELHVYPGAAHNDVAFDATVLDRVRSWYARHGMF